MRSAGARAFANLALVKYFGKRDLSLNLPAAGSLSLALDPLETTTEIQFDSSFKEDEVFLDGSPAPAKFADRVSRFLEIVRQMAGCDDRARVSTKNNFPTGAGLASSASGFAALAAAASKASGLGLDQDEMSALARRGSGSASRSVPGGIAVWQAGNRADGSDSFARAIAGPADWDLRVVVGVVDKGPKVMGSTKAMEHTRTTSPYYGAWIESASADLEEAVDAVTKRDFTKLGEITERSALAMHAAALAARPGIAFWKGATVEALRLVKELRASGQEAYFTCDAGPQPKALCLEPNEAEVARALQDLDGIEQVIRCRVGGSVKLIEDANK